MSNGNEARTNCDRRPILLEEWIVLLQQIVLQRIQAPQRFFVQLFALVRAQSLVQELLPCSSSALLSVHQMAFVIGNALSLPVSRRDRKSSGLEMLLEPRQR